LHRPVVFKRDILSLNRHNESVRKKKKRDTRVILLDGTKHIATWTRKYRPSKHPRIGNLGRIPGHVHNRPKLESYKSVAKITKVMPEEDHFIVYLQILKDD